MKFVLYLEENKIRYDLDSFLSLDQKIQEEIIKRECELDPIMFVYLFMDSYLKTGDLESFHKEWITSLVDLKEEFKMIIAPRGHAKSTVVSLMVPVYFAVYQKKRFVVIVSDSGGQAELLLGSIRRELEENEMIKYIFGSQVPMESDLPNKKGKGQKWTVKELFTNNGVRFKSINNLAKVRGLKDKDQRPDFVLVDDIEDEIDAMSETHCERSWQWFTRTLLNIGTVGTQFAIVGTLVGKNTILGRIFNDSALRRAWNSVIYRMYDKDGMPIWKKWWTPSRVKELIKRIGMIAFKREYLMDQEAGEGDVFNSEMLEPCKKRNLELVRSLDERDREKFKFVVGGMDLTVGKRKRAINGKRASDPYAFVTVGVDYNNKFKLLNIESKIGRPKEQREVLIEQYNAFNHDLVFIENNQFQDSLVEDVIDFTNIPVQGYTTTGKKYDADIGISSLSIDVENRKWEFPFNQEDKHTFDMVSKLFDQMIAYPHGHTGDTLIALWMCKLAIAKLLKGMDYDTKAIENQLYNNFEDNSDESNITYI